MTRHGYGEPAGLIPVVEAGHPMPDRQGVEATERTLALAGEATADDLVLVLLSGGGSANWIAPAGQLTLEEKQGITRALLRSGATIGEINTVRKHLSRIKGGRLAAARGAGPGADARDLRRALRRPGRDRLRPDRARPVDACRGPGDRRPAQGAAAGLGRGAARQPGERDAEARQSGLFGNRVPHRRPPGRCGRGGGAERDRGRIRAARARRRPRRRGARGRGRARPAWRRTRARPAAASPSSPAASSPSRSRGQGRGGPNQEYALALAVALDGRPGIAALAADTDGTDGGAGSADDPAGAIIDDTTLARARALGLDPAAFLAENDSTGFFERLSDLVTCGPTRTNVNDCRIILVG